MPNIRIFPFKDNDEAKEILDQWIAYNKGLDATKKLNFSQFLARTTFIQRLQGSV